MKLGTMLSDVFRSLFRRTATRQYPFERKPAPERLRGKLYWDAETCTGCSLCSKDCPANAIEIIMVDKAAKRFVVRYHLDRCTFCAQCVLSCPQDALRLSHDEWELADTSKKPFTIYYGEDADVEPFLVNLAESDADIAQEK
jgi:formate hydrogenlyase subunit 6/NADH:ubiquinone oxidoreductase subunit I